VTLLEEDDDLLGFELPRAPKVDAPPRQPWPIRRTLGRLVAAVVALLLVLWLFEALVGPLMYTQRQQHLSASYESRFPKIHKNGAALALQMPTINSSTIVTEGVSVDNLRSGPAHQIGSALPGDPGVMVIYGHRHAYGAPFEQLDKLVKGDSIAVRAHNGPIVDYRVDRVERHTLVKNVALGKDTDTLSYLVLVTSENGLFTDDQIVVVARALPLSEVKPLIPSLDDGPSRVVPFGIEVLLGNAALLAAVLAWRFTRQRASIAVRLAAVAPVAIFAVIRYVLMIDSLRSITR
jgi:LPXTG-site transpeptidase (sortase) family protein